MIKAAIFDLDGTLIDSTENDFLAWQRIFGEYGVAFLYEEYLRILGARGSEIVQKYLELPTDEEEAFLSKQETYFKDNCLQRGLSLIPNVEKLLKQIRNLPLQTALATGSSNSKLAFIFDQLPIRSYFDVITTADTVHKGKPDPEVFVQAAEKVGIAPRQCLVFEDAPLGVEAAKKAGMQCIVSIRSSAS